MATVRHPAVAGLFYPADPFALRQQIAEYIAAAQTTEVQPPKAIVAPHAGYIYSGPIAGTAYAQLASQPDRIHRVVLLGPSHRVAFSGLAYSRASRFRTPLGDISVDTAAWEAIADLSQVRQFEAPFEGEHCLEVHLPFLQTLLQDFRVVPLLVGEADAEHVAEVLARLWGGEETLIVISSDLSHYRDYRTAKAMDAETSSAIEHLHPEAITHHHACGRNPLNGLLREAQRQGLHARTLDLRNSGDTAGPRDQVVGYGAYVFH